MRISEIYGPVPQGEGALLGVAMPFIRVAACNLACSWCDSKYTWEKGYDYTALTPAEVVERVDRLNRLDPRANACQWVSLTGGEPTIYEAECDQLVRLLARRGQHVMVETNGLRASAWLTRPNVFVSCSPKLPGSGQDTPARRRRVARLVEQRMSRPSLRARTQFKFVIAQPSDLQELGLYCAEVGIDLSGKPGSPPVYVQPDGYIQPLDRYLQALAWLQSAAPAGVRVTPQVHRLIHGPDARSV